MYGWASFHLLRIRILTKRNWSGPPLRSSGGMRELVDGTTSTVVARSKAGLGPRHRAGSAAAGAAHDARARPRPHPAGELGGGDQRSACSDRLRPSGCPMRRARPRVRVEASDQSILPTPFGRGLLTQHGRVTEGEVEPAPEEQQRERCAVNRSLCLRRVTARRVAGSVRLRPWPASGRGGGGLVPVSALLVLFPPSRRR